MSEGRRDPWANLEPYRHASYGGHPWAIRDTETGDGPIGIPVRRKYHGEEIVTEARFFRRKMDARAAIEARCEREVEDE